MKFKVDENLPSEHAEMLRAAGHDATTVAEQKLTGAEDAALMQRCWSEGRILVTLDMDFANVRAYPPETHPGILVFRSKTQDKVTLIGLLGRVIPQLKKRIAPRSVVDCGAGSHSVSRGLKVADVTSGFVVGGDAVEGEDVLEGDDAFEFVNVGAADDGESVDLGSAHTFESEA